MSALPGDPTFNQFHNHYDVASYKRICAEFGVDPSSNFRFTTGKNHGLGRVNGEMQLDFKYLGWMKFSDEGGKAINGNRISYIRPGPCRKHAVRLVCPQNGGRFDTGRAFAHQPVNRGVRLLHFGHASQHSEQHPWRRREGERGPDRVPETDGGRHQTAGLGAKREKIPARSGSSEGQAESRRVPGRMADVCENGHQHGKHGGLQQQTQTGDLWNETGSEQ